MLFIIIIFSICHRPTDLTGELYPIFKICTNLAQSLPENREEGILNSELHEVNNILLG
jgi:hypothetical protein